MLHPTPLQQITDFFIDDFGIQVFVKRLDLLHPHVSGNKWFKLKYNIEECKIQNKDTILTFGGAYSNHIIATAAVGKSFGIKTIGIIRGEEYFPLNPVLSFAKDCGMELHYIARETYRLKEAESFINFLEKQFGNFYLIPEGGANNKGVAGCIEIINEIAIDFDYIAIACGTGATIAGISLSLKDNQKVIGIPVLKGAEFMEQKVKDLIHDYEISLGNMENKSSAKENFKLFYDYHFGGYAKSNEVLDSFIIQFKTNYSIPIEPVYTGKLFYGIFDLIKQGYFKKGSRIVVLHSGGLGV